jgi:hypothetical protein
MKLVRMKPGHGDVLLAEGDVEVAEDEERLIEEFRRQLDEGMWAAVPASNAGGHREATMVRDFSEVPRDAERVIFFPRAAGGAIAAAAPPDHSPVRPLRGLTSNCRRPAPPAKTTSAASAAGQPR